MRPSVADDPAAAGCGTLAAMTWLLEAAWPLRLLALATSLHLLVAALILIGLAVERRLPHRRIFAVPLRPGQRRRELRNNLRVVAVFSLGFTALLAPGVVDWGGRGLLAALTTGLACLAGFEVYYYLFHRAMHTRALIRIHREHHESHVTTPLAGFSLSVAEALGWLLGYALVPLLLSACGVAVSLFGFLVYVVASFASNVVGHANVEYMPDEGGLREKTWLVHSITYHALHHARYTGHYSFGTTVMDRLCGTEWPDWPELHARIIAGQPLTSLKQRGTGPG